MGETILNPAVHIVYVIKFSSVIVFPQVNMMIMPTASPQYGKGGYLGTTHEYAFGQQFAENHIQHGAAREAQGQGQGQGAGHAQIIPQRRSDDGLVRPRAP
jgi:hypothetical protein